MTIISVATHCVTYDVRIPAKIDHLDFSDCTKPAASQLARYIQATNADVEVVVLKAEKPGQVIVRLRINGRPDPVRPEALVRTALAVLKGRAG